MADLHIVHQAENLLRQYQHPWHRRLLVGIGVLLGGLALWISAAPSLHAFLDAQHQQALAVRVAAQAQADAERARAAQRPYERLPQASLEEVTAFAEEFLRKMGYVVHGELGYTHWTTNDAWGGAYKQYHFYAVIDPSWPPLALRCGSSGYYEPGPLACLMTK